MSVYNLVDTINKSLKLNRFIQYNLLVSHHSQKHVFVLKGPSAILTEKCRFLYFLSPNLTVGSQGH